MFIPPDHILYDRVWTVKEVSKTSSTANIRKSIAAMNNSWSFSEKRVRRLLALGAPNCAVIWAHTLAAHSRDDVGAGLCLLHIEDVHGGGSLSKFSDVLGGLPIDTVASIYERNPDTIGWYYEAFAAVGGGGLPYNVLASDIVGHEVKGDMLITCTSPGTLTALTLTKGALAKTLWYYLASGVDVSVVARQRTLERVLLGNVL
ncbi:hypothetical protein B0H14DRAFT_3459661 [Mycena olivaceomarginata]|nr:hypothetical protein B0H14DRAFT_3459661 [Mycena olivaceomarginata]